MDKNIITNRGSGRTANIYKKFYNTRIRYIIISSNENKIVQYSDNGDKAMELCHLLNIGHPTLSYNYYVIYDSIENTEKYLKEVIENK